MRHTDDEWSYQMRSERLRYEAEPKRANCPMTMPCIEALPTCPTCRAALPTGRPDSDG